MTATQRRANRPPGSRVRRLGLTLACLLGAWMTLGATVAPAKVVHLNLGSIDGSETPGGSLGQVWAAAVDNSSGPSAGEIYIGDSPGFGEPSAIQKFEAGGKYAGVEFDGHETPQGSFEVFSTEVFNRGGIAVDGSGGANAGDVYVADIGHNVVDRFSEAGAFLCQITGKAPATPAEEEAECAGSAGSETPSGGFGMTTGVAVDPVNGDVYVADGSSAAIDEFNEAGEYIGRIVDSHLIQPASLAFDSTGGLYVRNGALIEGEDVVRFDSAGAFVETLAEGQSPGYVATDLGIDHAYVSSYTTYDIAEYDAAGSLFSTFGSVGLSSLAVSASTGEIYAAQFGGEVDIYGPGIVVPEVTTGNATEVGETTATLHGEAAPDTTHGGGNVTSCEFEYVEAAAYEEHAANPYSAGQTVACEQATPYSSPTPVSAKPSLTPDTIYHYRLAAADAEGTATGADRSFITTGAPTIDSERATSRVRGATLRAEINPHGYETTCELEYVDQETYEASEYAKAISVPCAEAIPAGNPAKSQQLPIVKAELPDLSRSTTYHYRFVAQNGATSGGGHVVGDDKTFSTFKIEDLSIELLGEEGGFESHPPDFQAGSHPYELRVKFHLNLTETESQPLDEREHNVSANMDNIKIGLPPGLIGNPTVIPKCSPGDLKRDSCPHQAEVGEISVAGAVNEYTNFLTTHVYNLQPPRGVAGEFGAQFYGFPSVRMDFGVRTGSDYGIDSVVVAVNADLGVSKVEVRILGVPGKQTGASPIHPLLSNPTSCTGPMKMDMSVDTWQEIGTFFTASEELPAITGCNKISFEPELEARPTTNVSDSPSGLNVDLHVPQNEDPEGLRTADLKKATVTLPKGLVVNPSGANGLEGCTPAQLDIHGTGPDHCPDASKLGTVEVDSPLADHPLPGNVYIASPHNNPFNSLLALYIGVNDPETGVVVKLAGKVEADPQTGQLTTTFDENPQLPFEDLKLKFFGGAKAPLRTPATCGTYETTSSLTPWSAPESGPPATPGDSYLINQAPGGGTCPHSEGEEANAPGFEAGTITPIAGAYSPFVLHLRRADGSQQVSQLTVTPPPGLLAKLAGTSYCSEAALIAAARKSGTEELASPSCPASSRVGTVNVSAGAGPAPYWAKGTAYLAGAYKGAPLSLAIVTPAVAGPFDLGDVVVRSALEINPETTQVTVKSDPIPQILQGIPLDIRTISVQLDRSEFTRNPTSCDPSAVSGTELSVLSNPVSLSQRFQLGNCGALGFKPKLALHLSGSTKRSGTPALRATLTYPSGAYANIAKASVALPHSEFLDNAHIKTICTRVQFNEGATPGEKCPAGSIYGHARATTPLLDQPLEGPVYLRSSSHQLPDLVAALNGQIQVVLDGTIDSVHGGIRNRFEVVPDAPVSKFTLEMQGGNKGLLENSTNLCKSTNRATVNLTGQNGKAYDTNPVVTNSCKKKSKKHGKGSKKHH